MGSNEEIFWGGKSTKIQLYSAINIKSLVLFRFAKLQTQCKTTKNPLLTPPLGGLNNMILDRSPSNFFKRERGLNKGFAIGMIAKRNTG